MLHLGLGRTLWNDLCNGKWMGEANVPRMEDKKMVQKFG